ncbi:hypothetical protein NKG94_18615 [Micromonospora sp. M12]
MTVVGMGAKDDMVSLGALDIFHSARTLRSSVYGSSEPDREVPVLARAALDGTLDLAPLVSGWSPSTRRRRRSVGWLGARAPAGWSLSAERDEFGR